MAKIAFLSFYSGAVERGVENFVFELTKRLKSKHQITIFQAGQKILNTDIRTYQTGFFASAPKSSGSLLSKLYLDWHSIRILIFTVLSLPKIIKGKYQVIIPVNGGWQTVIIRLFSKLTVSKMIISGHAGIGADDAWNIFFRPDIFVALTSSQLTWAKKIAPEIQIAHIPNGVDLAKFNPSVKAKKISLKKPIVICVSALVPYKRIDLTIKAVSKTKNLSLLLLGNGQLSGLLDTLGKRLLKKRYLRLNPTYEQMPSYYRSADVFTLVSKTEAFGISYLEAMACNLPVVATNDASREEIIGNAGILTDPTNQNQYAKDLTIASQTNYRNIPYDQSLKFSWNKITQSYSEIIKQLTK